MNNQSGHVLETGSILNGYRIENVLGQGGFGITYLAVEDKVGLKVAIKEYFPSDLAARSQGNVLAKNTASKPEFQYGLDGFLEEAHTLARFPHPNIVAVKRIFKSNNTAYMVLEYIEGQTLGDWLLSIGRSPEYAELAALLKALLPALELIHKNDFLHRDLAPDNIYIHANGSPVLLDFGAARTTMARNRKSLFLVVKPGFSPIEQYSVETNASPASDIYSLAATFHSLLTNQCPTEATMRSEPGLDPLPVLAKTKRTGYPKAFLAGLDAGLKQEASDRPQSVEDWWKILFPDEQRSAPQSNAPPAPPVLVPDVQTQNTLPQASTVENCRIGPVLSQRSFYIVYQAKNLSNSTSVTLKEYFPTACAQRNGNLVSVTNESEFKWGYDTFIEEAWRFAEFNHPNIANIQQMPQANGTIYMVFDIMAGEPLTEWWRRAQNKGDENVLKHILASLLSALQLIHQNGYLHLSISPDTIFMQESGEPVFIDLFNCRPDDRQSSSLLVKDGYAPCEQYISGGRMGPWSDIYALGAVMYWMLDGHDPVSAEQREIRLAGEATDPLPSLCSLTSGTYSNRLLEAVDLAMKQQPEERPQNVEEWYKVLNI